MNINIVMSEPPGPDSQFVEVETDKGVGLKVGEWVKQPDGYWALHIEGAELVELEQTP